MSQSIRAAVVLVLSISIWVSAETEPTYQWHKACLRVESLRLGCYATSRQVQRLATDEAFRAKAWETLRRIGFTKLYLEVYRSGHVVPPDQLVAVRDWFAGKGVVIVGGIATVPGDTVGIRQEGPLGWFNWQDPKTQRDLREIIRSSAPIFETFIVDDFLCTGDVSDESKEAKGDRSWGVYRRELLTELARSVFIDPAKQVNPDITMIVKYPQWYDRFHLFGYDTETFPHLFDRVWVGTETRGRHTQRFGFVQPYEGFINYRWLAGIAGAKIGGAWFDHGDCAEWDFLDQAYTSVLAGASELVFFNLGNVMDGHPDHEKIVAEFVQLASLADYVRSHPVIGVPAYKPPNSDPGGDMYLMDFLGMLGIPLVPVHQFPAKAPVVFIPAQAAADPDLQSKIENALAEGSHIIFTTSLLKALDGSDVLASKIGVKLEKSAKSFIATLDIPSKGSTVAIDLEYPIETEPRPGDIFCTAEGKRVLFLRSIAMPCGHLSLLNTHTFNQDDFDAVGEVLLCPKPLGLLDLDGPPLDRLRTVFNDQEHQGWSISGPTGVTFHPFSNSDKTGFVLQNFNDQEVNIIVTRVATEVQTLEFIDQFSLNRIRAGATGPDGIMAFRVTLPARGRAWIQPTGLR